MDKKVRTSVVDADGVDELVEETGGAAPPLEDGNALSARMEGKELDKVGCGGPCQRIIFGKSPCETGTHCT